MEQVAQRLDQRQTQHGELLRALQQHQLVALSEQTQQSERGEAGLREAARQVDGLRASVATSVLLGSRVRSAVDTRTLGKPHSFSGRREAWREFWFVLEAFAYAAHPQMECSSRKAEAMNDKFIDGTD